ncbi:MAG: hypothetical protein ACO3FE_13095 [Planctomycetaceae bacterium]
MMNGFPDDSCDPPRSSLPGQRWNAVRPAVCSFPEGNYLHGGVTGWLLQLPTALQAEKNGQVTVAGVGDLP